MTTSNVLLLENNNNCGYIIQVCEQIKRISLKFVIAILLN